MHLTDKLKMHAQNVRREGVHYATTFIKNRVAWEMKKRRDRAFDDHQTAEGALHSQAIEQAFYRMLPKYALAHYPGTISLFRPKLQPTHVFGEHRMINRDKRFIYEDNGWSPHCMRVDVVEVPGDHDSMVLEPNVRVLAGRLRKAIEAAEAKSRGAIVVKMPARDAAQ